MSTRNLGVNENENFRQFAYGLSVILLFNRLLYVFAETLQFADITKVLFFGFFGIGALLLGLFKLHKGLSFGCVVGGIFASRMAWQYYTFKLPDFLRFVVVIIMLVCVCVALYLLYKKEHVKKG